MTYQAVETNLPSSIVDAPEKATLYLRSAFDENPVQEQFYVILLTRKNRALGRCQITIGTLTATLVSPSLVFKPAILGNAAAIIVAHNHPSGDPAPSSADMQITRVLNEAGRIMDIAVLDHVIVGTPEADPTGQGWYSFRQAGLL